MTETELLQSVRADLGQQTNIRAFRNNVGEAHYVDRRGKQWHVIYGLAPGSSDLIGFATKIITQEDVGKEFARFLSIETKIRNGKVTEEQEAWLRMVHARGGLAGIARTVDDARRIAGLIP